MSIIIRTYNEERYLGELLAAIAIQQTSGFDVEVMVVDSGSTDRTRSIAGAAGATVVHIPKQEFSFGRSLNVGCAAARGEYFVFVSGHCIPADQSWLSNLVAPLLDGRVAFTYGRQIGGPVAKFSETRHFARYFPAESSIPQAGFFCNNANAALPRSIWEAFPFDEHLTGLEDMHLGRALTQAGLRIGYTADAIVHHHHHETWAEIRRRYEREAIALQHIMPEVQLSMLDFVRYVTFAIAGDTRALARDSGSPRRIPEIVCFRVMQFWGAYRGNREHRHLSQQRKELYFYPR